MPSKINELKKEIQRLRSGLIEESLGVRQELRKINLEDVLGVCLSLYGKDERISHPTERHTIQPFYEIINIWSLGRPLDDQGEETIQFLFNLICKRN